MELHHPIMSKIRDLGGQTYRQTDIVITSVLVTDKSVKEGFRYPILPGIFYIDP